MNQEIAKAATDVASVSIGIATLMTWLPPLAALLTIIWTALRIYEMDTVQRLLHKIRNK